MAQSHLPSYIREHEKLKELGIDAVVCVATNDAYVMHAWGEQQGALGKVRLLADADAALATALGVAKPSGALVRSGRYSAVIVDNTVASFNDADAGGGSECTYADALLASLPAILAKAKDPLETFCESDPSADECRVYSD